MVTAGTISAVSMESHGSGAQCLTSVAVQPSRDLLTSISMVTSMQSSLRTRAVLQVSVHLRKESRTMKFSMNLSQQQLGAIQESTLIHSLSLITEHVTELRIRRLLNSGTSSDSRYMTILPIMPASCGSSVLHIIEARP